MRSIESFKINQTQPSHLPYASGTYPVDHDALQAHVQPLCKLGNANTIANYDDYYAPDPYQMWQSQWIR
jgi:hypothetical protein